MFFIPEPSESSFSLPKCGRYIMKSKCRYFHWPKYSCQQRICPNIYSWLLVLFLCFPFSIPRVASCIDSPTLLNCFRLNGLSWTGFEFLCKALPFSLFLLHDAIVLRQGCSLQALLLGGTFFWTDVSQHWQQISKGSMSEFHTPLVYARWVLWLGMYPVQLYTVAMPHTWGSSCLGTRVSNCETKTLIPCLALW
jgi:hypothetical protein